MTVPRVFEHSEASPGEYSPWEHRPRPGATSRGEALVANYASCDRHVGTNPRRTAHRAAAGAGSDSRFVATTLAVHPTVQIRLVAVAGGPPARHVEPRSVDRILVARTLVVLVALHRRHLGRRIRTDLSKTSSVLVSRDSSCVKERGYEKRKGRKVEVLNSNAYAPQYTDGDRRKVQGVVAPPG